MSPGQRRFVQQLLDECEIGISLRFQAQQMSNCGIPSAVEGRKITWPYEPPDWARSESPIVLWKPELPQNK